MKPVIFVIFGITGDLAQRKLLPALYHLYHDGLLHPDTKIIGLSRRQISPDELLKNVELCVLESSNTCDPATLQLFRRNLHMLCFDPVNGDDYAHLSETLEAIDTKQGACLDRLLYLSIPPQVYGALIEHLGRAQIAHGCQHKKATTALLIEKPFGYDLASAEELIKRTNHYFQEEQIYRIDHYLAKETAQNILTFRSSNPLFLEIWNDRHISKIEVIAHEKIGIGSRTFYDNVGALRDLMQSHLLQLCSLVTLEMPERLNESTLHQAKQQLLNSILPVPSNQISTRARRAQYIGYREEVKNPDSITETYVSLDLHIDTPRWQNTEVTLTTGKRMATKTTLIHIDFGRGDTTNTLTFRLQPDEGIAITLQVKQPGLTNAIEPALLDYDYAHASHPDAYERVLLDACRGDHMLFASSAEVLASWRILQPVLDYWQNNSDDLELYEPGRIA